MTPTQCELVQESWKKVVPIADQAASLFYEKLFSLDPQLKRLFKGDMEQQGRKLMELISVAVDGLDRIDVLLPALEELGQRHRTYGVRDGDYATVASALLWTLGRGLGAEFSAEVKDAWVAVYDRLSKTMRGGPAESHG